MVVQKSKIGTAHAQLDIVFDQFYESMALGGMVGIIVEPEETIEGEIEIEEIPEIELDEIENIEEKTVTEMLNTRAIICGLDYQAVAVKGRQQLLIKNDELPIKDTISDENALTEILISGTITDENGFPLPGVNVIIKNTKIGVQTDFDGNYSIAPEANQTLAFSYLGYESKDVTVSTISNTIDLKMVPDNNVLGEIIYTVGGFSFNEDESNIPETNNPFGYDFPRNDHERNERVEKRRKAKINEVAFQKIKQEKKKAAKAAKKLKRKRK
jgi:hypothetical protein